MHNKRIGRDDLLKIEVRTYLSDYTLISPLTRNSGHELLLLLPGATKLGVAVIVVIVVTAAIVETAEIVATEALRDAVHVPLLLVVETTHLARTIAVIVVETETETETETTMTADDLEPRTPETVTEIGMEKMTETAATMTVMLEPMEMTAKVCPMSR